MTVFISGGAKCGKSLLAQDLAVSLSKGGKRYYVATLCPTDEEDRQRIRRHVAERQGLEFETVECFDGIVSAIDPTGTYLVDSVTSLVQNVLFPAEKNYEMDTDAAVRCGAALTVLAESAANVVFVSDYIYADAAQYSESTEMYRQCLAAIDRQLAAVCDAVIEVTAGQSIVHKGEGKL